MLFVAEAAFWRNPRKIFAVKRTDYERHIHRSINKGCLKRKSSELVSVERELRLIKQRLAEMVRQLLQIIHCLHSRGKFQLCIVKEVIWITLGILDQF